jgi:cytochrome c553
VRAVRNSLIVVAVFAAGSQLFAATPTTLDGVYTQEQAERGMGAYNRNCAGCHQRDLNGTGGAPPLHTTTFTENWREGYLSNLFHHIQTWMPPQDRQNSSTWTS